MKILAITNIFPNPLQPRRGIYNLHQFKELAKRHELRVIAPLPWVPGGLSRLRKEWRLSAQIPACQVQEGIRVYHPRYFVTPKIGRWLYGFWLILRLDPLVRRIRREFPFDGLVATWAYPDLFAACVVARRLRVPLVGKVHGSDVNVMTRSPIRRRMIVWALSRVDRVIAVSVSLKEKLVELGVPERKIAVITNGVDGDHFKPMDKGQAREQLGLPRRTRRLVYVGNLVPGKGVEVLLEAFRNTNHGVRLSIIGEGPLRKQLDETLKNYPERERVELLGAKPHEEIPVWMNAADAVCLPSFNEGCPNVVVEALACGRPVVATRVGGIPELLAEGKNGYLVPAKNPEALAQVLEQVFEREWDPGEIQRTIPFQSWAKNVQVLERLIQEAFERP